MTAFGTGTGRRATRSEWSESATVVIPYTRFLERRAWREKILADVRRSSDTELTLDAAGRKLPLATRRAATATALLEP
jgi:hypothetical protein